MSALINQWGPWLFIACGAGWLFWPIVISVHTIRLNRKLAAMFSELPESHRAMIKQHLGPERMPPFPIFKPIGWQLPAVAAIQFAVGIIWLASR
jgi:hypothetical protein